MKVYSMEPQIEKSSGKEYSANLFVNGLQKAVNKKIFIQILLGMMLFITGFFFLTFSTNQENAKENLAMLKDVYLQLYNQSIDFLQDNNTLSTFQEKVNDPSSPKFEYIFNRFNSKSVIGNRVILMSEDGKILYSNFAQDELSDYLINYNRAICNNAKMTGSDDIYVAVYFDTNKYSDYMFVKPVYKDGKLVGYISLYLLGTDWNYYLSDKNYDGVIVDKRLNTIYRSKAGFANSSGKFTLKKGIVCTYNHERYWVTSEYLPEQEVTIYSLVYYPKNNTILIGIVVIVIIGLLWYNLAMWMSRSMAQYNSTQVSRLVKEIRMIQNGAHTHRIHMNTKDEFDEIGHRINRMLDSVRELNSRNTELILLNATLERGQLEAQMNLHFLYNTLEIIRNLVVIDADKAEELIEKLVHILRYSVSNDSNCVRLREDMEYINDYLYIQKVRFGERFTCNINFDESCGECIIPKLLLQPIIENSIKYGFRVQMEITIDIYGEVKDGILTIHVSDNGPGMPENKAKELSESLNQVAYNGKSLGLHNIARRLYLSYGAKSGIKIRNKEGSGFEVILIIEQKKNDGEQKIYV